MELCTRNFTSFLLFNSSFSSNSVLLRANAYATPFKFNSLKLSSFSPHNHIHLFRPFLSRHTSSPFTLSAAAAAPSSSSQVALDTEKDTLPAELKVTETGESNSTVCSSSSSFLIHFSQFYAASLKVVYILLDLS